MRQYEVSFIVDPVLSGDEIKSTAKTYQDMLSAGDNNVVHVDEIGLKQLAYPINKRTSGIYYVIEFTTPDGTIIPALELALRRDERIIRFLSVKLDRYGIKYNDDKRNGLIGKVKKKEKKERPDNRRGRDRKPAPAKTADKAPAKTEEKAAAPVTPTPVPETPAPAAPAVAATPKKEEE